jgi:thioredoxin 1
MALQKITDANFEKMTATSKPVMIDFWAAWCGPCLMIAPVIEAIAEKRTEAVVGKLNVDENPAIATKYGIRSIPTVIVLKNGVVVDKIVGGSSMAKYEAMIDKALGDKTTDNTAVLG